MSARPALRPSRGQLTALRRQDPQLAAALRIHGPYPGFPEATQYRRETHFGALGRAILFQQLAGAAASAIHRRVLALTPGPRFPRPEELLALPDTALRSAGVSNAKQRSLVDLAEHIVDGRLRLAAIGRLDDEAVIDALIPVRGIGRWSAQMFLISRLGRLDVMPDGDLGVQEGLRRLDGLHQRPGPAELRERADRWAPLRTVAAWTLWRLASDGPAPTT